MNFTHNLFDLWMDDKHPYYYFIVGLFYIAVALLIITVVFSLWFFPDYTVRLIGTAVVLFILTKVISQAVIGKYVEDFKDYLKR